MPIKRDKSLTTLSHDHHHGLILTQLIKKNAPEYKGLPKTIEDKVNYTINFFKSELTVHFEKEEKILYSAVKNKNQQVDDLFEEIIAEHKKIKNLVDDLSAEDDKVNILNELGELLEKHIRKEERILFEKIQELLSEEELSILETKLS